MRLQRGNEVNRDARLRDAMLTRISADSIVALINQEAEQLGIDCQDLCMSRLGALDLAHLARPASTWAL